MREPVTTTSSTTGAAVASGDGALCAAAVSAHVLARTAMRRSTNVASQGLRLAAFGPIFVLMFSPRPGSVVLDLHSNLGRSRQLQNNASASSLGEAVHRSLRFAMQRVFPQPNGFFAATNRAVEFALNGSATHIVGCR